MKKIDNFINCLNVLKKADFRTAENDEIYRMGVIGQFNLTFELAWKAIKAVLEQDGVQGAATGSARDILKLASQVGFIKDDSVWLLMLKKRNLSVHIYNEDEIDELMVLIRDSFIPAFDKVKQDLLAEQGKIEDDESRILSDEQKNLK